MGFSIRDLSWLTLVVAMGLGWWTNYRATSERVETLETWVAVYEVFFQPLKKDAQLR